jgi:hypothetical protein
MNARALLAQLARDGVTLQNEAGRLKVNAPAELDVQVLAAVKAHKAEILRELSDAATTEAATAPASTCSTGFAPRAEYEPALAAAYARKLHRRGGITAEQRDNLLHYANEAADNPTAPQVLAE